MVQPRGPPQDAGPVIAALPESELNKTLFFIQQQKLNEGNFQR